MIRVLVIAPHPDDEAIGCGGTLLRHTAVGDAIRAIFLTSGEKGCPGTPEDETASIREEEAKVVAAILGIQRTEFWREPDGAVQTHTGNVTRLRRTLSEWLPAMLYVPHVGESHPDHVEAAYIVKRALQGSDVPRPDVLMYEIWTPIQEIDHVEDITNYIEKKIQAVRAYKSQCDIMSFDEAIRGLNRYRGEMHSWPGGPYAEVFQRMLL